MVQYTLAGVPFATALGSMQRLGFAGVETHVPSEVLAEGRTRLRELLDAHKLQPVKLVTGGGGIKGLGDLAAQDKAKLRESLKDFRRYVLLAHDNGFPTILVFTGPRPQRMTEEASFELAAQSLASIADYASDHDVRLTIEAHPGGLVNDLTSFLKLRDLSHSKNVFANVDPSNYWVAGDDALTVLERLGRLVGGIHVKDVVKAGGRNRWALPGRGSVDWPAFLTALKSSGYDRTIGWLDIEYEEGVTGRAEKDPETGSKESRDYIQSLL
jgi:sugar phosphate isomerase/epimerase